MCAWKRNIRCRQAMSLRSRSSGADNFNVPIEAMSVKAVELLVAQMENRECKNTGSAFELELIIRETTKNR